MSTELPKTPPSAPKPGEGQGESKRAIDEVIDTPEALRRLAKRVKGILDGMNEKSNVLDSSGDPSGDPLGDPFAIDDTRQNGNVDMSAKLPLFDMSDFGCHEHVEEAKKSEEQKEEKVLPSGTPSKTKVVVKLPETS